MTILPRPPNYQFKPLTHQFDDGFGTMADAFNEAALRLDRSCEDTHFINESLPIAYLYRHAIELYLKAIVVVLHRHLQIPFGQNPPSGAPQIRIGEKWFPFTRVHNVADLYHHFDEVLTKYVAQLQSNCVTDWSTISTDLARWVAAVADVDRQSTFFRYPGAGDAVKGDFKESSIADIWARMGSDDPPRKAFVELDANDEVVGAFRIELSQIETAKEVLRKAANELAAIHFAFRCDVTGGM
ncbi:MAG TPA: hypothetical protein VI306_08495 [Pyrinomonadaceae bacterium]